MTIEDVFTLAASKELSAREWKWKPLKSYNGFSHEQRVRKWQAVDLLIRMGLKSQAKDLKCSICGIAGVNATLSYHSEDYTSLESEYPLCKSCHYQIHTRFNTQAAWKELVTKYGNGGNWFEHLSY